MEGDVSRDVFNGTVGYVKLSTKPFVVFNRYISNFGFVLTKTM